ncbi:MAG: nicotinate-nucleotide adenylyltransferase [Xanthomonadales bacterium]|nr:nicotinate-nucleotide adenylyltransferase [Xanthomonadales bacterium]
MSLPLRAFYGGTFDPVHNGHLAIALAARDALGTTIWMMPAADPPHRDAPGASAEDRAAMLELAIQGQAGLRVDRRELQRDTPSYTIDTLRELRAKHGDSAPLAFLIGADSLHGLATWKEPEALLAGAHWVVAERPGSALDEHLPPEVARLVGARWTLNAAALRDSPGGKVLRLRQPLHAESATQLRRRIAAGETWHHLLPLAVSRYIVEHGLYGATPRPAAAPGV